MEVLAVKLSSLPLVAAVLVAFVAGVVGEAGAFSLSMTHRNPQAMYSTSDTATMDVFLDAEPGLTILSVGVLFEDAFWDYDPIASAALPAAGSAGPGAQPSYILYTPGGGIGDPATILYPQQTPAFLEWPGTPPAPGLGLVNINYAEQGFNSASASGTGIWIGSLVFHLTQSTFLSTFELTILGCCNVIQTGSTVIDPGTVGLSAPIQLPEPNAAVLIALAFLGVRVAGRWRRVR